MVCLEAWFRLSSLLESLEYTNMISYNLLFLYLKQLLDASWVKTHGGPRCPASTKIAKSFLFLSFSNGGRHNGGGPLWFNSNGHGSMLAKCD